MEDSKASIKGYVALSKYPITGIEISRFEVMVRVLVLELQALQKIFMSKKHYIVLSQSEYVLNRSKYPT